MLSGRQIGKALQEQVGGGSYDLLLLLYIDCAHETHDIEKFIARL